MIKKGDWVVNIGSGPDRHKIGKVFFPYFNTHYKMKKPHTFWKKSEVKLVREYKFLVNLKQIKWE